MKHLAVIGPLLALLLFLWPVYAENQEPYLVKDINPGSPGTEIQGFIEVDSTIFFTCDDHSHGRELCKTDGTEGGTVLVKDINPGSGSSSPRFLTDADDTLYFYADDGIHGIELWRSNGTEQSTVLVADINPGTSSASGSGLGYAAGTLFFTANDGVHGDELWALEIVPKADTEAPPMVPEASTLLLVTIGAAGPIAYAGAQIRARRRTGAEQE